MFQLTKVQKGIQKSAGEFAKGEFDKEFALEMEREGAFPREIHEVAVDLGFIGLHFAESCGGSGFGIFENVLLAETLCRKEASIGSTLMLAAHGSEHLLRYGSEELKTAFLTRVAEDGMLSAAAIWESNGRGALSSIETTGIRNGDGWRINGAKAAVINAGRAGFYCVLCKTEQTGSPAKDLSLILVEADRDGVVPSGKRSTNGLRMTPSADLRFDNVRVPGSNLIGKAGKGKKQLLDGLAEARVLIAAMALGIAQGAMDRALLHVKQREQFGVKLARFGITRHKLADMTTRVEMARMAVYTAAMAFDNKKRNEKLAAMAKIAATRAAVEAADEAIQLLGGYGYVSEYEVERFYREARALETLDGTPDALKDTVAQGVIGKIR